MYICVKLEVCLRLKIHQNWKIRPFFKSAYQSWFQKRKQKFKTVLLFVEILARKPLQSHVTSQFLFTKVCWMCNKCHITWINAPTVQNYALLDKNWPILNQNWAYIGQNSTFRLSDGDFKFAMKTVRIKNESIFKQN